MQAAAAFPAAERFGPFSEILVNVNLWMYDLAGM
jgi:hypothetical protein